MYFLRQFYLYTETTARVYFSLRRKYMERKLILVPVIESLLQLFKNLIEFNYSINLKKQKILL